MSEKKARVISADDYRLKEYGQERGTFNLDDFVKDNNNRGSENDYLPDELLQRHLDKVTRSGNYANSVMEILPDLGVADELLTAHIMNPNDFTSADIAVNLEYPDISEETKRRVLEHIRDYFSKTVKLNAEI